MEPDTESTESALQDAAFAADLRTAALRYAHHAQHDYLKRLQDDLGQLRAAVKRWIDAEITWDRVKWEDTGSAKYRAAGELADATAALRKCGGRP